MILPYVNILFFLKHAFIMFSSTAGILSIFAQLSAIPALFPICAPSMHMPVHGNVVVSIDLHDAFFYILIPVFFGFFKAQTKGLLKGLNACTVVKIGI